MNRKQNPALMGGGRFFRDCGAERLEKVQQKMTDDHRESKDMQRVLEERGLIEDGFLRGRCTDGHSCNENNCCMAKLLGSQPDFLHQADNPWIKGVVESLGHKCIFLPKFHCELNKIEYFLGSSKRYTRGNLGYSWEGLQATVPLGLSSVSLNTIQRCRRASGWDVDGFAIERQRCPAVLVSSSTRTIDGIKLSKCCC